jgi:hypothetical protein
MFTAVSNGMALIQGAFFWFLEVVSRNAMGMLGTMLELVVFFALVWALLGSRTSVKRATQDRTAQRLRARQKELTLR